MKKNKKFKTYPQHYIYLLVEEGVDVTLYNEWDKPHTIVNKDQWLDFNYKWKDSGFQVKATLEDIEIK